MSRTDDILKSNEQIPWNCGENTAVPQERLDQVLKDSEEYHVSINPAIYASDMNRVRYITVFIQILTGHIYSSLTKKTGWGRNEVKDLIQESIVYALSRVADKAIGELDGKL